MSKIRLKIADYLDKNNLSIREFSKRADIAYNTALALKRGSSTRIDFDTLEKICILFDCQPGDLIVLEEDPNPSQ